MPFGLGVGELVIILVIVTVIFGATKLPQLGDGMGKAIRNFKRSVSSGEEEKSETSSSKLEGASKPD